MSFNQTKDLLDVTREFHIRLAAIYQEMLKAAATEEAVQLIRTLIEHEQNLEKRLGEYEGEVSANILDTYFKFMVDKFMSCLDEYVCPESITSLEVIEVTRRFDQCLSKFYKDMAEKAQAEHVREVLMNLMQMELREQMNLSRRTLELSLG